MIRTGKKTRKRCRATILTIDLDEIRDDRAEPKKKEMSLMCSRLQARIAQMAMKDADKGGKGDMHAHDDSDPTKLAGQKKKLHQKERKLQVRSVNCRTHRMQALSVKVARTFAELKDRFAMTRWPPHTVSDAATYPIGSLNLTLPLLGLPFKL